MEKPDYFCQFDLILSLCDQTYFDSLSFQSDEGTPTFRKDEQKYSKLKVRNHVRSSFSDGRPP